MRAPAGHGEVPWGGGRLVLGRWTLGPGAVDAWSGSGGRLAWEAWSLFRFAVGNEYTKLCNICFQLCNEHFKLCNMAPTYLPVATSSNFPREGTYHLITCGLVPLFLDSLMEKPSITTKGHIWVSAIKHHQLLTLKCGSSRNAEKLSKSFSD